MNANRFDEGYSEDTRSQSGSDLVIRTDSRLGEDGMEQELQYALPEEVMQMSESERSGMSILKCLHGAASDRAAQNLHTPSCGRCARRP